MGRIATQAVSSSGKQLDFGYVLAGLTHKQVSTFRDMAAYLEQRDKIEGITDLRPASASEKPFLRELEALEFKNAPSKRQRRLPIYAIGGIVQLGSPTGSFLERLGRLYNAYQAFTRAKQNTTLSSHLPRRRQPTMATPKSGPHAITLATSATLHAERKRWRLPSVSCGSTLRW